MNQPAAQTPQKLMARISPKRPANAPSNLALPWLEGLGRRFYRADDGFVPVAPSVADLLRRVHCDGELTERGGQGPFIFDVLTPEQAQRIVALEQKRALLGAAEGNAALKGALAGAWNDEDYENIGVTRVPLLSAAEIARQATAATATPQTPQAETPAVAQPHVAPEAEQPAKGRVGRRPPKGKAPLPGAAA